MAEPSNLIVARITDANGYIASSDAYFLTDVEATVGDLLNNVGVWLGRLQDCCGGRIVGAQIRLGVDVSPWEAKAIEPGASVSSCMVLSFSTTTDTLPWNFVIPAVSTSVVSGSGPDLSEDGTIDVLADQMENEGLTLEGFTFASNRGGPLAEPASGFFSTRKRDRLIQRKSIRVGV